MSRAQVRHDEFIATPSARAAHITPENSVPGTTYDVKIASVQGDQLGPYSDVLQMSLSE